MAFLSLIINFALLNKRRRKQEREKLDTRNPVVALQLTRLTFPAKSIFNPLFSLFNQNHLTISQSHNLLSPLITFCFFSLSLAFSFQFFRFLPTEYRLLYSIPDGDS